LVFDCPGLDEDWPGVRAWNYGGGRDRG
jgi:hypothetical protein